MNRKQRSFEDLAAPGVRGLQPYVPGKPNTELEREYGISESIKLASNESPLGPPAAALAAIRAELESLARYPDGSGFKLKSSLAEKHGIDTASITLGNGSNEILVLLAETFLTPGLEAIFDQYSFAIYRLAVAATGASARISPSQEPDQVQPYGHDLDGFRALLTESTRLVFIANPNNPTGTWLSQEELRAFMQDVPAACIVVVDEAYGEYVTRDDYPNTVPWLEEFDNLVITRTFSKIYGLAGLRVGYAMSSPGIAELLNRVRAPFNVNSLGLIAAEAALADDAFVTRSRELNGQGLEMLSNGFAELGLQIIPSIGNFVLVDLGRPSGPTYESLLREGIITRPVANYGLPNHLRITVGLPEQNEWVLAALGRIMGLK